MIIPRLYRASTGVRQSCRNPQFARSLSTLPNNPNIYYFSDPQNPSQYILSLLPTSPPQRDLALGTTPSIPPESNPATFTANEKFVDIIQSVLSEYAIYDSYVQASAAAYASQSGATMNGGFLLPPNHPSRQRTRRSSSASSTKTTSGAGPSGSQGGAGSGGVGGWVHVSDMRRPPDFGRIADPEDIFGSVEVGGDGVFAGQGGGYQKSGTYRIVTRDGVLGLSDYLRGKIVERLRELERSKS